MIPMDDVNVVNDITTNLYPDPGSTEAAEIQLMHAVNYMIGSLKRLKIRAYVVKYNIPKKRWMGRALKPREKKRDKTE